MRMHARPAWSFVFILLLLVSTYHRNSVWRDEGSLWTDTAQKSPKKQRAYGNLCSYYSRYGSPTEALLNCDKAITLNQSAGTTRDAYINRGAIYSDQGRYELALRDYGEALLLDRNNYRAYNNIAKVHAQRGSISDAVDAYSRAIRSNPNYELAYVNRGTLYSSRGLFALAIADFSRAIQLNRRNAVAYGRRGSAYGATGDIQRRMSDLRTACGLGYQPGCEELERLSEERY